MHPWSLPSLTNSMGSVWFLEAAVWTSWLHAGSALSHAFVQQHTSTDKRQHACSQVKTCTKSGNMCPWHGHIKHQMYATLYKATWACASTDFTEKNSGDTHVQYTHLSALRATWQIVCAASHLFGDLWSRCALVSQKQQQTFCLLPHKHQAREEKIAATGNCLCLIDCEKKKKTKGEVWEREAHGAWQNIRAGKVKQRGKRVRE